MDCLFCKIIAEEILPVKVYEDDIVLAFLDAQPRSPGHTMVIPKKHVENLSELPKEDVGPFFEAVQLVTNKVKKALVPDGFTLGMNYGRVSGQEVDHMHFHIMPRWKGDGGSSLQSVVSNKPTEELEVIAEKIKSVT
ncbi:MAG: HIT family protein [bacterium]|nr:HIT family protein [bacterium]